MIPLKLLSKFIWLVGGVLCAQLAHSETQTVPKYGPKATRLFQHHQSLQRNPSPDFWALIPYYTHQQTGSACSIASSVMILNGIRAPESLTSTIELFTQNSVLESTGEPKWKNAVSEKGGGVTLQELQNYLNEAFKKLKLKNWKAQALFSEDSPEFKKNFKKLLQENEKTDRNFLIANFIQGELTGDPEGATGHFAPIGAYNSSTDEVLILDPDRTYYEPYWVKTEVLFHAINTIDRVSKKKRGLLWVLKNP